MAKLEPVSKLDDCPEVEVVFRERAQAYADRMLCILADIAENSDSDAARVAAAKELNDRAHGKAPQAINSTLTQINPDDIGWTPRAED